MELKLNNLNTRKEKIYFVAALIISLIIWAIICFSIIGAVIAIFLAIFIWIGNGLLVAHLKSECVKINEKQLPIISALFKDLCQKINLKRTPDLYILQSGGLLNAFAMSHAGRDFVVLFSDIVEAYEQDSSEIKFLLGHEIGHIKSRHIFKQLILFPALLLPLLGHAYSRACEASCDRYGAFTAQDIDGAIRAIMILSGGKQMGKFLDANTFSEQSKTNRGFFVSWYELISGYPTLSQRVAYLIAIKEGIDLKYSRNPFAYFFALFSFGGRGGIGSGVFITIIIISLLVAIAIPNFMQAKIQANETLAKQRLQTMAQAADNYAREHEGEYPQDKEALLKSEPPYLKQDYCGKVIAGYKYECAFEKNNFKFEATPLNKEKTGKNRIFITKEGMFVSEKEKTKFIRQGIKKINFEK